MKLTRAQQKLVEHTLKKVRPMARRYANRWPSVREEDLASEGSHAIVELANQFDPSRQSDFDGFVYKRAKGAMYDHVRRVLRDPLREAKRVAELADDNVDADNAGALDDFLSPTAPTARQVIVSDLARTSAGLLAGLRGVIGEVAEEDIVDQIDRGRQTRELRAALNELDEPMRGFVLAHYFEGLTLEDASLAVGVKKRTGQRINDRAKEWLLAWFRRAAKGTRP